jgi:hypothetical protein
VSQQGERVAVEAVQLAEGRVADVRLLGWVRLRRHPLEVVILVLKVALRSRSQSWN